MQKYQKIILLALLLTLQTVIAQREGSIPLLALIENNGATRGGIANLQLNIQEGNGGVFLDTFPLTKFTTQISMRFAQQIACQELNLDCSNLNFFYTIKSAKGIIGGPSAGAAATILSASLLKNIPLNESVVITGTINSGGMIGSVGGLKEKIEAAAQKNYSKVLIPKGTKDQEENNSTIDMIKYGQEQGITVIEVGTLSESLKQFNNNFEQEEMPEFYIDEQYKKIMNQVAEDLCNRVKVFPDNFKNLTMKALDEKSYYSAASLCFRSHIEEKQKEYSELNIEKEHMPFLKMILKKKIDKLDQELSEQNTDSITDLQTIMSVRERIDETKELFNEMKEEKLEEALKIFAFAEERLYSAKLWTKFFELKDSKKVLDKTNLRKSCENKIAESEERLQYLREYVPFPLTKTENDLNKAYAQLEKDPISCLYLASKTKAGINAILSVLGIKKERIPEILEIKLDLVKKSLVRAQQKSVFPLISYSYYEYANSLKEFDEQSAILYAEYALEFVSLDMYFSLNRLAEKKAFTFLKFQFNSFISGLIIGLLIFGLFLIIHKKNKNFF